MLIIVCVGLIASGYAAYIYQYGQTDRAAPADAIIVLGGGVHRDGSASAAQRRRSEHGAALYKRGLAPYIICTGGYDTPRHVKSEAAVCIELLTDLGVPANAILFEDRSMSTEENAIEAHKVMREHNLTTAILVSDNFHLMRAEMLFRAEGVPVFVSPAQVTSGPLSLKWILFGSYREVTAMIWQVGKQALRLPYTNTPF